MRRIVAIALIAFLGGCASPNARFQSAVPPESLARAPGVSQQQSFSATSVAGVMVIGILLGEGGRYYERMPDGTRRPYYRTPESDPTRRINVQDCTRPVDPGAGNLLCR